MQMRQKKNRIKKRKSVDVDKHSFNVIYCQSVYTITDTDCPLLNY